MSKSDEYGANTALSHECEFQSNDVYAFSKILNNIWLYTCCGDQILSS